MLSGSSSASAAVPAGTVEHEQRVRAGGDGGGDLGEVQVHRRGVGIGQHQAGGDAALGADRAEEVGPLVSGVPRRARPGAAFRPDPCQRALLADARLVLEPDLERLARGVFGERRRYRVAEVFLNASWAAGSALGWRGRTDRRR